jgi:hypothetical protein
VKDLRCSFRYLRAALAVLRFFGERVLFIGTQFSILYTSMYSPAEAASVDALDDAYKCGSGERLVECGVENSGPYNDDDVT